jgi:hypothetical protein
MSCHCDPRRDPALILSITFTILSFGLLTISYSKIFIEFPLSKLTHVVDQHTQQIDTLSKLVKVEFTPEEATKITSLYEKQLNEKR